LETFFRSSGGNPHPKFARRRHEHKLNTINENPQMTQMTQIFLGLQEFRGLAPDVGATLVVALDWVGTRPTPTFADTPRNPKEHFL
jgi:hypothetical protein